MNRRTTIGLVIAFAALLLYVLLVQAPKDRAAAQATPTPARSTSLWSFTSDQVSAFWVEAADGQRVELSRDAAGAWQVTAPEARPADAAQADSAVSSLAGLYVTTELTSVTDLGSFGVLVPAYRLGVRLTDQSELSAAIGDKTVTGTGYYVRRGDEAYAVVVSASSLERLTGLVAAPPYLLPTPAPDLTPTAVP